MNENGPDDASSARELDRILAEYVTSFEAGTPPDKEEFLARHPAHREALAEFLANYRMMTERASAFRTAPAGKFPRPFGDYELIDLIAQGGMGVVYRARQKKPDRVVALKMIKAGQLATEDDLLRFRKEAESAAGLDHPNIVPIYEVGDHEGQPYFTMRLIEGGSLEDHLPYFRERPRETARLVVTIAQALRHAHQRAILHRDLKPANILLDEDLQPHVTDFGLAIRVDRESRLTTTGSLLGTLCYMAPEHARGDRLLTVRADVYSLGAILYEILTGQPPVPDGPPLEMLRKLEAEDPTHPRRLNPAVDVDLATICAKCLNKDPQKRYENCQGLIEDLENWLEGRPIQARPMGTAGRFWRWCRRNAAAVALAATAGALLLSVTGAMLLRSAEQAGKRKERLETNASFARQIAGRIQQRLAEWGTRVQDAARQPDVIADLVAWNRRVRDVPDSRKRINELIRLNEATRLQESLKTLARSTPDKDLENWQIMDDQGMMIARTPTNEIAERAFAKRDYFEGALRHENRGPGSSVHVSTAYYSVIDECYKVDVSCPILDDQGKLLGVIAISLVTSRDWGLPDLGDERRKAVLIARSDPSEPKVKPLPEYVILLHPLLGTGAEPPGFRENPFPIPYSRDCGAELLASDRAKGNATSSDRYEDPFGALDAQYAGPWLAAFSPVGRTGMVAVVQQRDE